MDWGFSGGGGGGGGDVGGVGDLNAADWQSDCSAEEDYEAREIGNVTSLLRGIDDELYRHADEHFKDTYRDTYDDDDDDDGYAIGGSLLEEQEQEQEQGGGKVDNLYDPAVAAKMWYMNRAMEDAVPYKDWVSKFPFMRVVGTRIEPNGTDAGVDAGVGAGESPRLTGRRRGACRTCVFNEISTSVSGTFGR